MNNFLRIQFDGTLVNSFSNGIGNDAKNIKLVIDRRYQGVSTLRFRNQPTFWPDTTVISRSRRVSNIRMMLFGRVEKIDDIVDLFVQSQVNSLSNLNASVTITRIHDIFPATNPEWFSRRSGIYFKRCLKKLANTNIYLCNSDATRTQLSRYLESNEVKIEVLHCGIPVAQYEKCGKCDGCSYIPLNKFGIAVGTVEPRKNYACLIKAWESYRVSDKRLELLLIGKYGWKQKNLGKELSRNSLHGMKWLSNVCDGSLNEIREKANFYISTSFDEGFNIAAAEACQSGLTLILSDISAHQETHPEAIFFDPRDHLQLTGILMKIADERLEHQGEVEHPNYGIENFSNNLSKILAKYNL